MKYIIVLLLLAGCKTYTQEQFSRNMSTWQGQDINLLVEQKGYPDRSFEAPNGNKVYVYAHIGNRTTYTYYNYSTGMGVSNSSQPYCIVYFEVVNNKIIKIRWEGNSCKAYEGLYCGRIPLKIN